ncbi:MAG TPA: hypothetical protein VF190_14690 [Rhodothermales bacterium]
METSNERDYQERRTGPTVSKEKWVNHAKAKLTRGYVLIVGKKRKTANFYLKNKGYEMCGYDVAKQLIKDGLVVESGEHTLGTVYSLASSMTQTAAPRVSVRDEEEHVDEMDTLLNQIAADGSGDPTAPSASA